MNQQRRLLFAILVVISLDSNTVIGDYLNKYEFINETFLGTKAPYRIVQNLDPHIGTYPGCAAVKIWTLNRHGTRYPSDEVIYGMQNILPMMRNDILKNYNQSKTHLTAEQIKLFQEWDPPNINITDEKKLAPEGAIEMFELANRMQIRFQDILSKTYDKESFRFLHTPTQRAYESAKSFAAGLFGKVMAKEVIYNETSKDDPVLRFYKNCKYWEKEVKKNTKTYAELSSYIANLEMIEALDKMSLTLGFDAKESFSYDTGKMIYQACAFETAWNDKTHQSPWCFAFNNESILALEYAEDLKYYWVDGYGYNITWRIACNVLRDVVHFFRDENGPKAAFHFTHSGTLLKTLAFFGLYKTETPLSHKSRDPNRPWRVSYIDTFGANMALILYKCDEDIDKVLLLHEERPVRFPECPNDDLCPLRTIMQFRKDALMNCDLKRMCALPQKDEL